MNTNAQDQLFKDIRVHNYPAFERRLATLNSDEAADALFFAANIAIETNDMPMMKFLLDHGLDPFDEDPETMAASIVDRIIIRPGITNRLEMFELVITRSQPQPSKLNNLLTRASSYGRDDLIQYLLDQEGVDIHYQDDAPLILAANSKNAGLSTVQLLVENGANINARFNTRYPYPLVYAISHGKGQTVQYLLDHGAKIDGRALERIGVSTDRGTITMILDRVGLSTLSPTQKATILNNIVREENYTPIRYLIEAGLDPREFLLAAGLPAEVLDTGTIDNPDLVGELGVTNLMITAQHGPVYRLRGMVQRTRNINAQDQYGNTALHYAVESGNRLAAEVLLLGGADHRIKNQGGYSPVDYAEIGPDQMVELFQMDIIERQLRLWGIPFEISKMIAEYAGLEL